MPLSPRVHTGLTLAAAVVGCSFVANAAFAEMRVLESDVPDIKVDSIWPDSAQLAVPPGKHVRVLLLPSNVTKMIEGKSADKTAAAPWGATRQPSKADGTE